MILRHLIDYEFVMNRAFKISLLVFAVLFAALMLRPSSPSIRNSEPEGENIICFGDSLTSGTGASDGMDYPSQLSRMLSIPVINAGAAGDTTGKALLRLERDVLSRSPKIVLITLGGNDLKNRVPKQEAFENLGKIIESIQEKGALVVVGGLDFKMYGRGFGEQYRKVAEETGSVLIENVFEGIMGEKALMSDPIHPNDKGYTVMAERFKEAIEPYI